MKRSLVIVVVIIALLIIAVPLIKHLLSLPLPGFMVDKLKKDIISSHENDSSLSVANGRLVFARNGNIYSIALDGTDLRQLTNEPTGEWDPNYSDDGSMICYRRQFQLPQSPNDIPYDYNSIMIMNADGGNQQEVVKGRDHTLNEYPAFSPDSKKIVFLRLATRPPREREPDETRSVCEINIDGTELKDFATEMSNPVYSTDGNTIYASEGNNIWSIDRQSNHSQITGKLPADSYSIRYSPDRKRVVFIGLDGNDRMKNPYQYQVYTGYLDGSGIRKLTNDWGPKHNPTFTSDGSEIVFLQEHGRKKAIRIMSIDGANVRTIIEW